MVLIWTEPLSAPGADRADYVIPLPVFCPPAIVSTFVDAVVSLATLDGFYDFIYFVFIHLGHLQCF